MRTATKHSMRSTNFALSTDLFAMGIGVFQNEHAIVHSEHTNTFTIWSVQWPYYASQRRLDFLEKAGPLFTNTINQGC